MFGEISPERNSKPKTSLIIAQIYFKIQEQNSRKLQRKKIEAKIFVFSENEMEQSLQRYTYIYIKLQSRRLR